MTRQFGISFETLSRRADATGISHPPGSHGVTQYYADSIPLPSGSIAPLEPLDLSKARFNRALVFALFVNFGIWALLAFAVWLLFFARF